MSVTSEILKVEKQLEEPYRIEQYSGDNLYIGIDKETKERLSFSVIPNLFNRYIPIKNLLHEIQESSEFDHENIIKLVNLKTENHFDDFKSLTIVFERMDTDLYSILHTNQELTESHRRFFIYQILRGLKYLHSANFVHKNLRPDKIMLDSNCDLKILTLGHNDSIGCFWYAAPETLLDPFSPATPIADMWSIGCILYELIMRKPLFPGRSVLNQLTKIVKTIGSPKNDDLYYITNSRAIEFMNSLPKVKKVDWNKLVQNGTSDEIDLIKMMLEWNPSRRISVDEALKHQYFEELHDPYDEPSSSFQINLKETEGFLQNNLKKYFWEEIQRIRKNKKFK